MSTVNPSDLVSRLSSLLEMCRERQYRAGQQLPNERFQAGEYHAKMIFALRTLTKVGCDVKAEGWWPFASEDDAHGSTFMGLMFLANAYRLLLDRDDDAHKALRDKLEEQLASAQDLPGFFQGAGSSQHTQGPKGALGWWPLLHEWRLPALDFPADLYALLPLDSHERNVHLAAPNDADFWGWCMDINASLPAPLQLRFSHPIEEHMFYEGVLGTGFSEAEMSPHAKELIKKVNGDLDPQRFPLGTYYKHQQDRQRVCCAVNASVLAAIPLLGGTISEAHLTSIKHAASFVDRATIMLLQITSDAAREAFLRDYAYSYSIIFGTPLAYVIRYQRRIEELKHRDELPAGYPDILQPATLHGCVTFVEGWLKQLLATSTELYSATATGGATYASLIYGCNALMNLYYINCINTRLQLRVDIGLLSKVMKALLRDNPAAQETPGTGPYPFFPPYKPGTSNACDKGSDEPASDNADGWCQWACMVPPELLQAVESEPRLQVWTFMSSPALVLPALIEAMTLYVLHPPA